jgi:hypothetical protein
MPDTRITSDVTGADLSRPAGLALTDGKANRIAAEAAAKAVGIQDSLPTGTFYFVNRETGRCLDAFASGGGVPGNKSDYGLAMTESPSNGMNIEWLSRMVTLTRCI